MSPEWPDLLWVPPASWDPGRPAGPPLWLVVHYTAGSEGPTCAEDGAAYDTRRTDGTSAHYYVDSDSVVQCVRTTDRAHTALFTGNQRGIHYELCGTAQTPAQWADPTSDATITRAAKQMARDAARWGIPPIRITPAQVRAGVKGVCGHGDITAAFPEDGGDHTDPGSGFPWTVLIQRMAGTSSCGWETMDNTFWSMARLWATGATVDGYARATAPPWCASEIDKFNLQAVEGRLQQSLNAAVAKLEAYAAAATGRDQAMIAVLNRVDSTLTALSTQGTGVDVAAVVNAVKDEIRAVRTAFADADRAAADALSPPPPLPTGP